MLTPTTYSEFQGMTSSEKIALVVMEVARRLMGWELHSGSVYKITGFTHSVIVSIEDSGTALSAGASASLNAGEYYHDRSAQVLYLRTSDSVNPNGKFIGLTFKAFFSNVPVAAPHDLSTGFDVEWLPLLKTTSEFGVELDNRDLIGLALEGAGKLTFINDHDYWRSRFDKWTFENQKVLVYSWHRDLPITEAKIVYRGRIQKKGWAPLLVTFDVKDIINELRAPVPLSLLSEFGGALVPPNLVNARQRLLYGYVKGHRPTNIDQNLSLTGYTITGTAAVTKDNTSVTGTGTAFLAEVSPDDELIFGNDTDKYTVESVTDDGTITLTEPYAGTTASGVAIRLLPALPKRYMNRRFLIAGHAIREPTTTVTVSRSTTVFDVADATDFEAEARCLVNGEVHVIERVSGNRITLRTALASVPTGTVKRLGVENVYLGNRLLTRTRDYTYDVSAGTLTLDELAEFNVAPVLRLTGTLAFTSGSRTVTGTSTQLKKDLAPGMWVRRQGQDDWFEILSVDSDTQITLRTAATYTSSGASERKDPQYYVEGDTVLSCDVLGATEDGTSTGTFIKTAAQMVKDLLTRAGLSAEINTASFTAAQQVSEHKLGIVVPERFSDTKAPSVRDVINKINQSVFGSLYQNEDFELEYAVLSPGRLRSAATVLEERDVVGGFRIDSDASRVVGKIRLRYLKKEFDPSALQSNESEVTKTSDVGTYLARSDKEQVVDTYLVDATEAQHLCNRWAFILEVAASRIEIETKMQGARLAVNDRVELHHEKLYERVGTTARIKVGGAQGVKRSLGSNRLDVEDLANAFSRCAVITADDALPYSEASDTDKLYNGYITDDYGMQDNDPDTHGVNLIW